MTPPRPPSSTTDTTPALSVAGVSHAYGKRVALDDVSLAVAAGSFTALVGVNGAGKTTLFNLVTRLFGNTSGRIEICGFDVRSRPGEALRRLGVVFQSRALDASLSVRENIAYQAALHGIGRKAALARGAELLESVGMADRFGAPVRTLSGGQMRRVEIIRALIHQPRLLLCDEATVGLDVQSRLDIVAMVHDLARDTGTGVLWATHLIDEIAPDDRVVVLHQGKVLATGVAAEIAGSGTLTEAFLGMTGISE